MTDREKLNFIIAQIQDKANQTHCCDEDNPEDGHFYDASSSGNYDDAFDDGTTYGEIEFARTLLGIVNVLNS